MDFFLTKDKYVSIQKSFKRLAITLLFGSSLAYAGLVNGVSVVVDNEPITLYEVYKVSQQLKVDKRKALDLLVRQRLEESQIKKLGISANTFEVDAKIESLATQNGITPYEFTQVLKSKKVDIKDYKQELQKKIKQEKLFQRIFANKVDPLDSADVKRYYEQNKAEFTQADAFNVTTYKAPNKALIEKVIASPMSVVPGVTLTQETLEQAKLNPKVAYFLNQTKTGEFTPVLTMKDGAITYLIGAKKNPKVLPFEKVQRAIEGRLNDVQRQEAITNYFEKLKAKANIQVLRRP